MYDGEQMHGRPVQRRTDNTVYKQRCNTVILANENEYQLVKDKWQEST